MPQWRTASRTGGPCASRLRGMPEPAQRRGGLGRMLYASWLLSGLGCPPCCAPGCVPGGGPFGRRHGFRAMHRWPTAAYGVRLGIYLCPERQKPSSGARPTPGRTRSPVRRHAIVDPPFGELAPAHATTRTADEALQVVWPGTALLVRPRRNWHPVPAPPPRSSRPVLSRPDPSLPDLGQCHRRHRFSVTTSTPAFRALPRPRSNELTVPRRSRCRRAASTGLGSFRPFQYGIAG